MSTCISKHGEYSEHGPLTDGYWCERCGALDEAAMRKGIEAAVRKQITAELYAVAEKWAERANDMLLSAEASSRATTRSLAYAQAASIASGALVNDLPEEAQS